MRLVEATLAAHSTPDGLVEMNADVPIGRKYLIDIDSLRQTEMYNCEKRTAHWKWIVDAENGRWLSAADLLTWPGKVPGGH